MITETKLVTGLVRALQRGLPGFVIIKHHDPITSGVPDVSVTGRGRTTWLEVKYANPTVRGREVQSEMVRRLALAGSAFYVVYRETVGGLLTEITSPKHNGLVAGCPSISHEFVVDFIKELHT